MVDYREILRLSELYSQRQIAASVGSSHHTIKEVLETANAKGIKSRKIIEAYEKAERSLNRGSAPNPGV